ncbi:MAG: aminotransferase class V-fold PLP-dependent enzyme [Saccharospirillum sp.]
MTAQATTPSLDWTHYRNNTLAAPDNRLYCDWTASGRLYRPIEERLLDVAGPMMANTHTEDSATGRFMTQALHEAETVIRRHINAGPQDVMLMTGTGMTGALAKLIRMLGLWVHEQHRETVLAQISHRPVVFVTHMEHHSNHTLWLETLAEVRVIPPTATGEVDLAWLESELAQLNDAQRRYASVTAASNVTGVAAPYRTIARLMHQHGGYCFVDFACAAPYVDIDMHPEGGEPLDAVFFSPHKFLGGPGACGILAFNKRLYRNRIPDQPGGGTVLWTNPWGEHRFLDDIVARESGGTPGILQGLKAAMAIRLKEQMGTAAMSAQEQTLNRHFFKRLDAIEGVEVLAGHQRERLSVFSILFKQVHYQQAVQQLSFEHGIEARGGCACAGTYGHYLLGIDQETSQRITRQLDAGELSAKPGWVRLSFHPMMTLDEVDRVADAVAAVASGQKRMSSDQAMDTSALWELI